MMGTDTFFHALQLLACVCVLWHGANATPKKTGDVQVMMPHHSFAAPLDYQVLLDDWVVSGASLFEHERLLLHPGVSGCAGLVWSKTPLLTDNFEVVIHFRVSGDKEPSEALRDQGFGFWYVYDNISSIYNESAIIKSESWTAGMVAQGFTLAGAKAKFHGLGVVLSMADAEKRSKPAVSGFTNDGHTTLAWGADLPTPDAKPLDFRNSLNPAQLKIRVQPNSVQAWLKLSPSLSWNECFSLDRSKHPIKPKGFIGLSAWSGTPDGKIAADLVSVTQMDVVNMDENSIGEGMKDVSTQIQETYMEMLTDSARHFLDQKAQTDHIVRLIDMLGEHLNATKPVEAGLFDTLKGYEQRMEQLGEDCRTMKQSVSLLMGSGVMWHHDTVHKAGIESMRNDIVGIRRLLVKESESHKMKIEAAQKNIQEVKEKTGKGGSSVPLMNLISDQTDSLAKTVQSRGKQMSWMLICLMAAIVGIGVLMWNRMRYYEKKHFI